MTTPFFNYFCGNLEDLKGIHPGPSLPVSAIIFGPTWPLDEEVTFYTWDWFSVATPDDDEAVKPYAGVYADDPVPPENGRWLKIDYAVVPQVNSDWNAVSGPAAVLNKPVFAPVAGSGSYTDLTDKPLIPSAQVASDWNSVSGVSLILNKPSIFSGSYLDLTNKPTIPNAFSVGTAGARTVALATAYQATNTAKAAMIILNLTSTSTLSLTAGLTASADIIVGTTSAVATGTGMVVGKYSNGLTGTLIVGLNIAATQTTPVSFMLPVGWFFAVRQTAGTISVVSAFDTSVG